MKAIVWTAYGGPETLQLKEVPTPEPKPNEVRVRIRATTVTAGDAEMRSLNLPLGFGLPMRIYAGLIRPVRLTILGQEFAGEIDAIGQGVQRFESGQPVFGVPGFSLGCYAEYICLPVDDSEAVIAAKPATMSYQEAAAVPFGGMEALHFLRKAQIKQGEHVVVNGAGGSIGTFGVQLAKVFGASVTAVDSGPKLNMLRSIGADQVVDYTRENFFEAVDSYDVIFDVIGKSPFGASMRALKPGGRYVLANPQPGHLVRALLRTGSRGKCVISGSAVRRPQDLEFLSGLIERGELKTAIDRVYPLAQMVEAHRYVETGKKQGNLVIEI